MDALCDDLTAEHAALDAVVAGRDLTVATPAEGWSIADQLSHLWYYDERAVLALTDPAAFAAGVESMLAALATGEDPSVMAGRTLAADELLAGWREGRAALLALSRDIDPSTRVPWYGPVMGARSFVTARLMETWAHGQDVADALGITRTPTARLRHVAHIGVGARSFSFMLNGIDPPAADVRVELLGPTGDEWVWGPADAVDRVSGRAIDFCLLVTQRRHRRDVDLDVVGPVADTWLNIAQAFAGPPGKGRAPAGADADQD